MKVIREDAKKEWKPNLNYKHIKDVLDNALSRGKYINNEREEVKAALDLCDKKQKYTPEQRKFIQDSHREMWKKNRKVSEEEVEENLTVQEDKEAFEKEFGEYSKPEVLGGHFRNKPTGKNRIELGMVGYKDDYEDDFEDDVEDW